MPPLLGGQYVKKTYTNIAPMLCLGGTVISSNTRSSEDLSWVTTVPPFFIIMNLQGLSKKEINQRISFICSHKHTGLDHPNCYKRNNALRERIGFVDIETTNLQADFGYIFTICIKPLGEKIITLSVTPREIRNGTYDKRICKEFIKLMDEFTKLVGHYSQWFDLPFLRTRCVYWKLPFPVYGQVFHKDTWQILRNKFKFHSNRLEAACDMLGIPSKKTRLNPRIWQAAGAGRQSALNFVLRHNKEDVISLEALWKRISPYIRQTKSSI